jgi:hypothetical protein
LADFGAFTLPGPRFVWSDPDSHLSADSLDPSVRVIISARPLTKSTKEALGERLDRILCLNLKDHDLASMRTALYSLPARGNSRHILHGLSIANDEHLKIKREVASSWCRSLSRIAATRAVVPFAAPSVSGDVTLEENQAKASFWISRMRLAILDCYSLNAQGAHGSIPMTPKPPTWSPEDLMSMARMATRTAFALKQAAALPRAIRRSGWVALKTLPRCAGALAVLAAAYEARREHNILREQGQMLIELAEEYWQKRLNQNGT